jgi:hypothetical protein
MREGGLLGFLEALVPLGSFLVLSRRSIRPVHMKLILPKHSPLFSKRPRKTTKEEYLCFALSLSFSVFYLVCCREIILLSGKLVCPARIQLLKITYATLFSGGFDFIIKLQLS